jgi:Asp-tRNA(Asn)/Glu-tRNA(Gln) amidotransferase A subunit family amidase
MSSIHEYQVDHLLLLVGSNPLPNAVAGKLLVAAGGMITLIHSQDTASLAERLESWLKSGGDSEAPVAHVDLAEVKESDADSVYRRVEKVLRDYESKARQMGRVRMGLHYTGGTKVMSVHAYRALEDWARDQSREREALFSYLDAHTLNMYIKALLARIHFLFMPVGQSASASTSS